MILEIYKNNNNFKKPWESRYITERGCAQKVELTLEAIPYWASEWLTEVTESNFVEQEIASANQSCFRSLLQAILMAVESNREGHKPSTNRKGSLGPPVRH